eukprot:sb/3475904/
MTPRKGRGVGLLIERKGIGGGLLEAKRSGVVGEKYRGYRGKKVEGRRLEPTESSKQPIRTRYLGHVTGYQPIRDQYFLIRSVSDSPEIGVMGVSWSNQHTFQHSLSTPHTPPSTHHDHLLCG